jgi:hypothetical protein
MSRIATVGLAFVFLFAQSPVQTWALEAPATSVSLELTPFASEDGLARLARSDAKVNFPALANEFEAEYNGAFCGPASAAIVLNAIRIRSDDVPRDRSRLRPEDLQYMPAGLDPTIPRFTQDSVIAKGKKTRAQVFGEPVAINGKEVHDFGYQARQLDEMLRANGLTTRLVIVDGGKSEDEIRRDLVENLSRKGDYAIVAYQREAVGQPGFGHISPLGAYDAQSDSFLVLDVNPSTAGWVWMATSILVKGMRTFDTVENRGYVLIETH